MIYSLVNNDYQKAIKGTIGKCPSCNQEAIPKCGEVKIHHWSHENGNGWGKIIINPKNIFD